MITPQYSFRLCEDDAVHKIPYKRQTYRQNRLKISVFVTFKILLRTRFKKIFHLSNAATVHFKC